MAPISQGEQREVTAASIPLSRGDKGVCHSCLVSKYGVVQWVGTPAVPTLIFGLVRTTGVRTYKLFSIPSFSNLFLQKMRSVALRKARHRHKSRMGGHNGRPKGASQR